MRNLFCAPVSKPARAAAWARAGVVLALSGVAFGAGVLTGDVKSTTSNGFPVHTIASAPAGSKPILESVKAGLGFVPNLFGTLAESPTAIEAYAQLAGTFEKTTFTPTEQTVILLSVSVQNQCKYCVPAHSMIGKNLLKVEDAVIKAVREGKQLSDAKLEALRSFTLAIVEARGEVGSEKLGAFLKAGYTRRQALDVIVGVGVKTLSNYTNRLVDQPLDEELSAYKWDKPVKK